MALGLLICICLRSIASMVLFPFVCQCVCEGEPTAVMINCSEKSELFLILAKTLIAAKRS